ncbi:MAG: hypothetical protein O9346_08685 [Leptospiraceae bacterium]|nr:hypothetical protein [Leptospiraceae bacterium]MCZ8346477.1 hypothetical protein [Leptospiraceae bacterium]
MAKVVFSFLFFSLLVSCSSSSSFIAVSPAKKQGSASVLPVTLSLASTKCPKSKTYKQWSAFYGMIPFSQIQPETLFPNPKSGYRIREEFTTSDRIYSLLLGVSSSIIRKSWIVEECPLESQNTQLVEESSPKPAAQTPEFEASVKSAVDAYLLQKDREYEEVLEATMEKNKTKLKLDETLPTIWLRNGEIQQGEVLEQNQESITIKTKSGESQVLPRAKVLRIRFPQKEVKP